MECPPRSLFHYRWTHGRALHLTLLSWLLGKELPDEIAAIQLGCSTAASFCKAKFSFAQAWHRGGWPGCVKVCIYLPSRQYRLVGQCQGGWDWGDEASPFRFPWGWDSGGWGLVCPLPSRSFLAPPYSSQCLSDPSSLTIFWVRHILPSFPPFHLLPLAPSHFFLGSNLLPPCLLPLLWSQASCPRSSPLVSIRISTGIAVTAGRH